MDQRTQPGQPVLPVYSEPVEPGPGAEPPLGGTPPRRRGRSIVDVILGLALVVAVGGVAFAAGRATAPTTTAGGPSGGGRVPFGSFAPGGEFPGGGFRPDASFRPGQGGFGFPGGGSIGVRGTVTAIDATSITIETESGQSVTIGIDGSTSYHRLGDSTLGEVVAGTQVDVSFARRAPGQAGGPAGGIGAANEITIVP